MKSEDIKDVVVYGTGAIGSVIATFLQDHNLSKAEEQRKNIKLVGRERIFRKIKENGLSYIPYDENNEKIHTEGYELYTNIKDIKSADLIFLTMKAHNLKESLDTADHLLKNNPYVFITMNGLGLKDIIKDYVDEEKIIECIVNYPSHLEGNTVKNSGGNSNFMVKETENPPVDKLIGSLFNQDKFDIRIVNDFYLKQWKKAIMNIGMNGISAITMMKVGEVLERKTLGRIIKHLIREAIKVANKEGIEFDEDMIEYFWKFAGRDPTHKTSTLQDIERDKPTEVEFMNGYIVKRAKDFNLEMPANRAIFTLMRLVEEQ